MHKQCLSLALSIVLLWPCSLGAVVQTRFSHDHRSHELHDKHTYCDDFHPTCREKGFLGFFFAEHCHSLAEGSYCHLR